MAIRFERAAAMACDRLRGAGRAERTVKNLRLYLGLLRTYLTDCGIDDLRAVDRACMVGYAAFLRSWIGRRTGRPLRDASVSHAWGAAVYLFRTLYERGSILVNPTRTIRRPSGGGRATRVILSEDEVARFLDGIDTGTALGLRDRALFELIYSSGLRSSEAAALRVEDIDVAARLVKVRQGKCRKDRVIPMTENAAQYIAELVRGRRPEMFAFRARAAQGIKSGGVGQRFVRLMKDAGLYRNGVSVHALRHACATHLLAHGADLRYVQELLGHRSVETTVRYTNEDVTNLRKRYVRAHPRENEYRVVADERYRERVAEVAARVRWTETERARRASLRGVGRGRGKRTPGGSERPSVRTLWGGASCAADDVDGGQVT